MTPVVSVRDLRLRRGTRDILNGVTFDVGPGEVVALMGLSGSGKTTILRVIAGLEAVSSISVARGAPPPRAASPRRADSLGSAAAGAVPDSGAPPPRAASPRRADSLGSAAAGAVSDPGGPLPRAAAYQSSAADLQASTPPSVVLSGRVGMVFQFHYLFEHLTVMDNVCLAPVHVHHVSRAAAETRARTLLDALGIGHRSTALPRELSGGEAQRAAIARALAMDPPLLLLDEPTASLDPARRTSLGQTLGQLGASGRAILVTSHDVDFVRDHATRVLILAGGAVAEAGEPGVVLSQPTHDATRALLQTR